MAGTVELGLPAIAMSLFADSLRSAGRPLALAVAPDAVKGGVGAADEVEVVNHDPRPRQLVVDRLPVGLIRVDRHDIDRPPFLLGQRAQVAFDDLAAAAVEHLDYPPVIQVRDDGR